MSGLNRHALRQGPVIAALLRTGVAAARGPSGGAPEVPGPVLESTVGPRADSMIRDYVRHIGGDPAWYRHTVPAHLFPQWGFPLLSKVLAGVPYDLRAVLNAGCRMEIYRPIQKNRRLHLKAWLEDVKDDGRRDVLTQRLETTPEGDDSPALVAKVVAVVPLQKRDGAEKKGPRRDKPRVADEADELARFRISAADGRAFAALTGDFNPVHMLAPYARAAGFKSTINHGFSTMARAVEGLNRVMWAGDSTRLRTIDVRFTRPLLLPAKPGLFAHGRGAEFEVWVGDAPGGPAYLQAAITADVAVREGDDG